MLPAEPGNINDDEDNDGDGSGIHGDGDGDGIGGEGFRSKRGRLLPHSFTPQSILSGGKYLFRCSIGVISSKLFSLEPSFA